MSAKTWTDENVALIGKLWKEGMSATAIGQRLGVSRNAVLSKLHRSGIADRPINLSRMNNRKAVRKRRAEERAKERRAPAASAKVASLRALFPPGEAPYREMPEELPAIPVDKRKGIADLEHKECRWPTGDPREAGFHFCARPQADGLPYCPHHARVAYRPLDDPPRRGAGRKTGSVRDEGSQNRDVPASGQSRETEEVS